MPIYSNFLTGSVTNFFPTVVATLGYGNIESLLLTAPPYVRRTTPLLSLINIDGTPGPRCNHSISQRLARR